MELGHFSTVSNTALFFLIGVGGRSAPKTRNWFSQKGSEKKSFHISIKSHNIEVKLCNLSKNLSIFLVLM